VYAKEDINKELPYAVKCLKTEAAGEDVEQELSSLLKLDHPNIITYHATYEDRE
jgi:serine/threonine protein kinase